MKPKKTLAHRAFSLLDLITTISVIAATTTVAIPVVQNIRSNTQLSRVKSSLSTLNSAVNVYLANGGEIPTTTTIEEVMTKLKSVRQSSGIDDGDVAFSGPFIDLRLGVEQVDGPSAGVRWNASAKRFELDKGANRYQVVLSKQASVVAEEERPGSFLKWGKNWVWDFVEPPKPTAIEPTVFVVQPEPPQSEVTILGPTINTSPSTISILNVGINSANNPGFEYGNGFKERTTTFTSNGKRAWYTKEENVTGWNTTASDRLIEIWDSGFNGVNAYSGNFFAEFNATEASTLWQEVNVLGYDVVNISFAHGQRVSSSEQLKLMVGTSPPARKQNASAQENLVSQGFVEVLTTNTNAVSGWQLYSEVFPIPPGEDKLYFAFQSIGTAANSSYGNFLDEVSFRAVTLATLRGIGIDIAKGDSISNVIESAKITLKNAEFEDRIEVTATLPSHFTVEKRFIDEDTEITITGRAFRHEYATYLESVEFSTSSPVKTPRTLEFVVYDGYSVSEPAEYLIEFD